MTLPTAVREMIRSQYGDGCIHRGGMRSMQRALGDSTPQVCIEDAMLRIHAVSYRSMREYCQLRRAKMAELGCFDDTGVIEALRKDGVPLDSSEPLWFDVFLWLMMSVRRFYEIHERCQVYVMLFDRGTPPAKYLKHIERYRGKTKSIPQEYLLESREQIDNVFSKSPYIPAHVHQYMKQKGFVDALIRRMACHFIPRYYHPPAACMFILDGPSQNRFPLMWKGDQRCELTSPMYRNHCLESDLSIIFWCNVFKKSDIRVVTADGDVLLALLLYTRYRISGMLASAANNGRTIDFSFINNIYLEQASKVVREDEDQDVSDAYLAASRTDHPNELNGGDNSHNKQVYLDALQRRYERQREVFDIMMQEEQRKRSKTLAEIGQQIVANKQKNDKTDDSPLEFVSRKPTEWQKEIADEQKKRAEKAEERLLAKMQGGAAADNDDKTTKKRRRNLSSTTVADAQLSNEQMMERYDIYYGQEGVKLFRWYEVVSINHLYQAIHEDLLFRYDRRLAPALADSFLPIENFVVACKICGDDYVKKPTGIGEKFILKSFYKYLNENGNLVYGKNVDTSRFANFAPEGKSVPSQLMKSKLKLRRADPTYSSALASSRSMHRSNEISSCTASSSDGSSDGADENNNDGELDEDALLLKRARRQQRIERRQRRLAASVAHSTGVGTRPSLGHRNKELQEELMDDYAHYLQLIIDYEAVVQLLRNAFVLKGKSKPYELEAATWVMCANLRYSVNYFANDFKVNTTFTDCFDVHAKPEGCGKSLYGYELPNPNEHPSQKNIQRPTNICDCFVKNIRAFIDRRTRRLMDTSDKTKVAVKTE